MCLHRVNIHQQPETRSSPGDLEQRDDDLTKHTDPLGQIKTQEDIFHLYISWHWCFTAIFNVCVMSVQLA